LRSEVGSYYQAADLFILPTLSDGYALTQLEALSHGLPVMASECCGEAVTHGQNGWILEDLDPVTIAEAIKRVRTTSFPDVRPPQFTLDDLAKRLCLHEAS
jgi:glycosyltransferase involved in cell wall biosynthesis